MATPTTLPATFVAGNVLTAAQMNNLRGAFRVLQVVSTTKTDIFSSSQAAGGTVDVTGLSATITPSATSSKILVFGTVNGITNISTTYYSYIAGQLKRNGTVIGGGTTAGNRTSIISGMVTAGAGADNVSQFSFNYLDSPSTTSAVTYQIALFNVISVTATLICNQHGNDGNVSYIGRPSSSITVMEISA